MRYSHERRLAARGAVNAVPENCSAYSPNGQRCGELRPRGSAPDSASVANSLPKPLIYPWESGMIALTAPFYVTGSSSFSPKPAIGGSVAGGRPIGPGRVPTRG